MPISPAITSQEVHQIADLKTEDLQPFIDVATTYTVGLLDGKVSDELLRIITIYMSAHFAVIGEGGEVKMEKIGDSTTTFNHVVGDGLESTVYGRTASAMDSSGCLKATNSDVQGYIEFC